MNLEPGMKIRSFDFPGIRNDCYMEGEVISHDHEIVKFKATKMVSEDKDITTEEFKGIIVEAFTGEHWMTHKCGVEVIQ